MKTVSSIAIMVVAVFMLAFSAPALAFSEMDMDKMGDMMGMCIANSDKIGLSDDQIMKMKARHSEMQKKHAQFKADLKIADIEFMDIMYVKDFDIDKARAAVKKVSDIKMTHHLDMLKSMKEMRAMLTEEQFKMMKKMMMDMKTGDNEQHKMRMDKY